MVKVDDDDDDDSEHNDLDLLHQCLESVFLKNKNKKIKKKKN